jgi:hypothetical protein
LGVEWSGVVWETDMWVGGRQEGKTRDASVGRPRQHKVGPDLYRLWVVLDTTAVLFGFKSVRWATILSG